MRPGQERRRWFPDVAADLPVPSDRAWHYLTGPELRTAWGVDVVPMTRAGTDSGRAAVATIDHCAHGNGLVLQFAIVDWRAGERVSDHLVLPGGTVTLTTSVTSKPFGSRVLIRAARPVPPTILRQAMLRRKVRGLSEIAHRFWVQSLANMVELAKRDATVRPAATVAPTRRRKSLKQPWIRRSQQPYRNVGSLCWRPVMARLFR